MNKKCPLCKPETYINDHGTTISTGECWKDECAWWNTDLGMCSMTVPGNLAAQQIIRAEYAAERQAMKGDR